MTMTFNLNKIWYGVRKYQGESVKKNHDNTIKDNVTVTSSKFSGNNRTISIWTHFYAKNRGKLPIEYKHLIQLVLPLWLYT